MSENQTEYSAATLPDDQKENVLMGKMITISQWADLAEARARRAAENEHYSEALEQWHYAAGLRMALTLLEVEG